MLTPRLFCAPLPVTAHIQRHGSHLHDDGAERCELVVDVVLLVRPRHVHTYIFELRDVALAATGQAVALHHDKHGLVDHLTWRMGAICCVV